VLSNRLRHIFLIFSTPEVLGGDFDTARRDLMVYNQVDDPKKWGKGPQNTKFHVKNQKS